MYFKYKMSTHTHTHTHTHAPPAALGEASSLISAVCTISLAMILHSSSVEAGH
jgi:hypothetical protein